MSIIISVLLLYTDLYVVGKIWGWGGGNCPPPSPPCPLFMRPWAFTNHSRARKASKNEYLGHFRTVPGRFPSNFTGTVTILTIGRRCVEKDAPNSPGVFIKSAARKQPVQNPKGRIRGSPGYWPGTARLFFADSRK